MYVCVCLCVCACVHVCVCVWLAGWLSRGEFTLGSKLTQAVLERAQAELAADRQAFNEKSRKLDAIMKQVQGLQEP